MTLHFLDLQLDVSWDAELETFMCRASVWKGEVKIETVRWMDEDPEVLYHLAHAFWLRCSEMFGDRPVTERVKKFKPRLQQTELPF